MSWFMLAAGSLLWRCVSVSVTVWGTLLLVFMIVPAVLGVSPGVRSVYLGTLLRIFEWATSRMELRAKEKNQHLYKSFTNGVIAKEPSVSLQQEVQQLRTPVACPTADPRPKSPFHLAHVFCFCRRALESVVDDEVTKRFLSQEPDCWNLLTRSNYNFRYISRTLSALWGLGVLVRYGVLLPVRFTIAATGIALFLVLSILVGFLPDTKIRCDLSEKVHLIGYRFCVTCLTAIITYHNRENKPKNDGICVANHTTPIDVIILANDGNYSMVGQLHGGLFGMIQRAMVRSSPHIWFQRTEVKDRHLVAKRLSDHVADKSKSPILVFPEGTCINNTSVMMFRKGSFEIGCTVYPVAIKYDSRFGDAFWNSSKFGLVRYLLRVMSSWAVVCTVWYLPPMNRQEGEDAVQFANRVKAAIAAQGGFVDLVWDGGLKRTKVKDTFKEEQQRLYSHVLVGERDYEDQSEDKCLVDGNPAAENSTEE